MPLFDVTNPRPVLVKPNQAYSFEFIQAMVRKLNQKTFDRMVQTVDEAVDSQKPSARSRLVWTRSAALFGRGSLQPRKHVDHLWENAEQATGPGEFCLQAVGGLLRWRISRRDETWLVFRRETGEINPITGKKITVSEYWIDNNFQHPVLARRRPASSMDISRLASAWGVR